MTSLIIPSMPNCKPSAGKNIFDIPIFSNAAASLGKIVPPPPPTIIICLYPASFNNFLT